MIPKHLREQIEAAAEEYKQNDFKDNTNGYTVAPYVNSETTSDAFYSGAEKLWELMGGSDLQAVLREIEAEIERLKKMK